MAIKKENKPNTQGPSSTWPYGELQDKIQGGQAGTPLNRQTHEDFHEFFERLMDLAGIEHNGLQENAANGWQFIEALGDLARSKDVLYNGYVTRKVQTIGAGDLSEPSDCSADPVTGILYVAETVGGNQRVFAYDIHDGTRLTGKEFGVSRPISAIVVYNDVAYYTAQDGDDLIFNAKGLSSGNSDSINVYSGGGELDYLTPAHYPDIAIDLEDEKAYFSKGDTEDLSNYNTGYRVIDISDITNLSLISSEEFVGLVDEAFTGIEVVKQGGTKVVAVAEHDKADVNFRDLTDPTNTANAGTFTTGVGKFISILQLGPYIVARGDFLPNQFTHLPSGFGQPSFAQFRGSTEKTEQIGKMSSYHRQSIDANGYPNHKVFVCSPSGEVEVWLHELTEEAIR